MVVRTGQKRLDVWLREEDMAWLGAQAKEAGVSRSQWVRAMVEWGKAKIDGGKTPPWAGSSSTASPSPGDGEETEPGGSKNPVIGLCRFKPDASGLCRNCGKARMSH